jgi:hypothetical protein
MAVYDFNALNNRIGFSEEPTTFHNSNTYSVNNLSVGNIWPATEIVEFTKEVTGWSMYHKLVDFM